MKSPLVALIFLTILAGAMAVVPSVKFEPSKINFAKKNTWEVLASKWMGSMELKNYVQDQKGAGKQLIFVDYNGAQYRGLFSDKIKYRGYYWAECSSEKRMGEDIAYYKRKGLEPSYIYRNGGGFTAIFVNPEQLGDARKILDDLGIGECAVK